jgi:hypothetical protein
MIDKKNIVLMSFEDSCNNFTAYNSDFDSSEKFKDKDWHKTVNKNRKW